MLEFSNQSNRIARKEHKCDLCGEVIRVGEKYSRYAGKYDGQMFDYKHHLLCLEMISEYCLWAEDNEYTEDDVIDWLMETVCYNCEHSWHGDGKDDCETSIFLCPKVVERFSAKDGDTNG